nr:MAG TPA: Heat shock factor binding protein 1 [Caudoviricetes sp.]
MLDEKDLQAIAQLMDQKMAQQKKEIIGEVGVIMDSKIRESESRMMVMMEAYFDPKFQALSEQINPVPKEAIDILEDRVDDLEKTVELHTQQINDLKMA